LSSNKVSKNQVFEINKSSQAVAVLKEGAEKVSLRPEQEINVNEDPSDSNDTLWIITLHNLKIVILTCDLEIRNKYFLLM
jgi:hypothetical protein